MNIRKIIKRAVRMNRVKDGLVLCDHCDTPASAALSQKLGWTACTICVWGEADSFDPDDLIAVDAIVRRPA